MHDKGVAGFSKKSKEEKIDWLIAHFLGDIKEESSETLAQFWLKDSALQEVLDGFSENTISNFPMPFGIAPNFLINGKMHAVPMVIEESSVVAAAASAAKFWLPLGGFHAEVVNTVKLGQVHFKWNGTEERWKELFPNLCDKLTLEATHLSRNMEKRGGGVLSIDYVKKPAIAADYYQLLVKFETCDSMGANFINSILEQFGATLKQWADTSTSLHQDERQLEIIMAILSNYTPECVVKAWVSCSLEEMKAALHTGDDVDHFARKFETAVNIARHDPYRAVTHNKGIFNGIDAIVLATGNDFRAIEACGHAYAARSGQYRSLSRCKIENNQFYFELEIPLALGTVGGLTHVHPLACLSLQILQNPNAEELMKIVAVTGLAQNFGALRSLVTTGIQAGHMKMHLQNILHHLGANAQQKKDAVSYFDKNPVSFSAVRQFLENT